MISCPQFMENTWVDVFGKGPWTKDKITEPDKRNILLDKHLRNILSNKLIKEHNIILLPYGKSVEATSKIEASSGTEDSTSKPPHLNYFTLVFSVDTPKSECLVLFEGFIEKLTKVINNTVQANCNNNNNSNSEKHLSLSIKSYIRWMPSDNHLLLLVYLDC